MMKIPVKQFWSLLYQYVRPQWRRMTVLAMLLFTRIGLRLLNPQIIQRFLDQAFAGAPVAELLRHGALFLAIAAAVQILAIASVYMSEMVGWTATNALRFDLLRHCLRLDMDFHKAQRPGELTERIDSDVDVLSNFFSRFMISVIGNGLVAVGVLVLMYRERWELGLAFTAFTIGGLLILMRLRNIAVPYWNKLHDIRAKFYGFMGEQFSGTEDIRANGAEGYVMRNLYTFFRRWLPANRNASLAGYSGWMTNAALVAVADAIAFAMAGALWFRGQITIGTAYLIVEYARLLFSQVADLRWQLSDLQHAEAGIQRLQALFDLRSKLDDGTGGALPSGALSVAFRDVSFAYSDTVPSNGTGDHEGEGGGEDEPEACPQVLRGLNFELGQGRVLGLLGRTGSGKTTLARLLLRLYDPTEGEVALSDRALTETTVDDVRRRVALVTQEVQLFQATVRDNLTFFDPEIADAKIEGTLRDLGLEDWLASLPAGLDTELSAGGGDLSAGQAQLLAFARVFLADPDLVILDEASSRLDPATEQLIERAVDRLLDHRTGIVIAHRLNTVQRADEVMILENGEIREMGDREQLAADPDSHFYHLLQTGMEEVLA
jgi:ATP-binding cassette subfamily B protein